MKYFIAFVIICLGLPNAYTAETNIANMPQKEFDKLVDKCSAWFETPEFSKDSAKPFCECATEYLLSNYSQEKREKWSSRERALKWKPIWEEKCVTQAKPIKDAQYSEFLNMCIESGIKDLKKNHEPILSSENLRDLMEKNCVCRANELDKYSLDEINEWTVEEKKRNLTEMEKTCQLASAEVILMLQCLESNKSATTSIENEKYCLCFISGRREAIQNGDIKLNPEAEQVKKGNDIVLNNIKEKCSKLNDTSK